MKAGIRFTRIKALNLKPYLRNVKAETGVGSMVYVFNLLEKRLGLLHRLEGMGFKVRMHGYEYFVRKDLFVFVLTLFPRQRRAVFHKIAWNLQESAKAIEGAEALVKQMDPELRVEVI